MSIEMTLLVGGRLLQRFATYLETTNLIIYQKEKRSRREQSSEKVA